MNFVDICGFYISDSFGPNPSRCGDRLLLGPANTASEYLISSDSSGLLVVRLRVLHDPVDRPVEVDNVSPLVSFQGLLQLHQESVQLRRAEVLQIGLRLIRCLGRGGLILDLGLGASPPQVFLVVRMILMQILSGLVEFTVYSVKVFVEVRPDVRLDACDDNGF